MKNTGLTGAQKEQTTANFWYKLFPGVLLLHLLFMPRRAVSPLLP